MSENPHRVDNTTVSELKGRFHGQVLQPTDDGYDEARTVWNAMIDRRPAIIVQPADTDDVIQAVNFAREHDLVIAVRGGGHNVAGNGVCEGGLMIDCSSMTSVTVEPGTNTAWAEPGVTIGEFDRATQPHGLATPGGIVSTTGLVGLTLGAAGVGSVVRTDSRSTTSVRLPLSQLMARWFTRANTKTRTFSGEFGEEVGTSGW